MDGGLRVGQFEENRRSQFALPRSQRRLGDDRLDVGQEAVIVLIRGDDGHVQRGDPARFHAVQFERDRQAERGDGGADCLLGHAGVEDGGEDHVAADAVETVEVGDAHRVPPGVRFGAGDRLW